MSARMLLELLELGPEWQASRKQARVLGSMPPGLPPALRAQVLLEPLVSLEWTVEGPGWVMPWV